MMPRTYREDHIGDATDSSDTSDSSDATSKVTDTDSVGPVQEIRYKQEILLRAPYNNCE